MLKPARSPTKPWVSILLTCPPELHRRMKIAAAEERLTLQNACFAAFEAFLRSRGVHADSQAVRREMTT